MIWVDYAILAILAVSAVISIFRGFVREALSLTGWVIAFWVALTFSGNLAELLVGQIGVASVRQAVAFFTLFVIVLLLTAVAIWLAGLLVDKTGVTGTDRMLGVLFGVARGIVVVALLVLVAGLTPLPEDQWWQQSVFLPHFEAVATDIRALLPPDIAARLTY